MSSLFFIIFEHSFSLTLVAYFDSFVEHHLFFPFRTTFPTEETGAPFELLGTKRDMDVFIFSFHYLLKTLA